MQSTRKKTAQAKEIKMKRRRKVNENKGTNTRKLLPYFSFFDRSLFLSLSAISFKQLCAKNVHGGRNNEKSDDDFRL